MATNKNNTKNLQKWRYKVKARAVEYKGGKCSVCGYDRCQAALQFHHLDRSSKSFSVSEYERGWEAIKAELDKCILVCANCHAEIEYGGLEL